MKIILFADKLPPEIGGMEIHAHYFVQHFSKGNDLIIISKRNGFDVVVNYDYKIIKEIVLLDFLKSFENEKCTVFYNSGFWIENFIDIKKLLKKAVFLYRTGGNEINKAQLSIPIALHSDRQKYWVNAINNSIDFLIANSQFTNKRLIDLGVRNEIIKIISGGVDSINIQNAINQKLQTRKLLNCNETYKLIVCCCRFVPYKRVDYLLSAFQYLPKQYKIILVGDGNLLDNARITANNMNLNVNFLGRLSHEETLRIIAAANIYCQASTDLVVKVENGSYVHTEGMGRSLIESICCGNRVVVTNCGALDEFINFDNGVLVDEDETEFARQIELILSLPSINEINRQTYCDKYNFERIFNKYEDLWN
ncbi:glycosyltransferase family 4 protein [Flavobacterium sp.]|uniref:glycosyltransferase family 4 protein n=1 Tax=Flavobacterium sp. TaxID=239 RepID=UPI0037501175